MRVSLMIVCVCLSASVAAGQRPTVKQAPQLVEQESPKNEAALHLEAVAEVVEAWLNPRKESRLLAREGMHWVEDPGPNLPFSYDGVYVPLDVWNRANSPQSSLKAASVARRAAFHGVHRNIALNYAKKEVRKLGLPWTRTTARAFELGFTK